MSPAIDEGIEMEAGGSAASSNSDASSVSSEAATNDRNARELASKVGLLLSTSSMSGHVLIC